ncbi:hypothetical protein [Laceyella putida]|uniref:Uncharacterized protein n=1 Tax=Laceyella putida TaxID=110101 RepID=A0ABW2RNE4_9BACL
MSKWKRWISALLLPVFVLLGAGEGLLHAEEASKLDLKVYNEDGGLVFYTSFPDLPKDDTKKASWTYAIDGIGTQVVKECIVKECDTTFDGKLFAIGKTYRVTITVEPTAPEAQTEKTVVTKSFKVPPPDNEDEVRIQCGVAFDPKRARYYLYARLTVDPQAHVEGSWTYIEKETKRAFRQVGDRDTSFIRIGNTPGKVQADLQFDGIINHHQYFVEKECHYVKEGIHATVSSGQKGLKVTGNLLYGQSASGNWRFDLKNASGNIVKSVELRKQQETEVSHLFQGLKVGKYSAIVFFTGTVDGKTRHLGDDVVFSLKTPHTPGMEPPPQTPPDNPDDGQDGPAQPDDPQGADPPGHHPDTGEDGWSFRDLPTEWALGLFGILFVLGVVLWIWVYRNM